MQIGNDKSPIAVCIYDPSTEGVMSSMPVTMTGTMPISGSVVASGTVAISNPVSTVTVANPVSTVTVANPVTTVTVANPVNSVTVSGTVSQANPYSQTAGYTQINSNGTTTVKSGTGVFFGINPIGIGATATVSALDGTTSLMGITPLVGISSVLNAAPQGVGVRFGTSLVVVTAGITPATVNALWD